jgi:Family of unknown function (DUF6412)
VIAWLAGALLDVVGYGLGYPAALLAGGQPAGLTSSGLAMLAAITLTGMLIVLLAAGARIAAVATAVPLGGRAAALREKSWRAAFLPLRDPDAPGRARPRAPTAAPAAA